jgi:hypothetical protein
MNSRPSAFPPCAVVADVADSAAVKVTGIR